MLDLIEAFVSRVRKLEISEQIEMINHARELLHTVSPFKNEPIDFVKWVPTQVVTANDYNPNSVAPPEMALLEHSIEHDGYTQPVVGWFDGVSHYEVIDGFHRTQVAKNANEVRERLNGYMPIVGIQGKNTDRNDRIASTIRHNRARGKHKVDSMSDIVVELKKRNWSDNRIAKELGMDSDEVLRLCQITGLAEVFGNEHFSQAWDAVILSDDENALLAEDDIQDLAEQEENTRIFHEWTDWECYPAGFYNDKPPKGMTTEECEKEYENFLRNIPRFDAALDKLIREWPNSCQHYLTNEKMNRIAWLGQASMCLDTGISSRFCGGYNLLTDSEKLLADSVAFCCLNKWLAQNNRPTLRWEEAKSKSKANIY